jgi:hypothetical protein
MSNGMIEASERSLHGATTFDLPRGRIRGRAHRRGIVPAGLLAAAVCCAVAVGAVAAIGGQATALPAAASASAFDGRYSGPLVAASEGRTGECARRSAAADLAVRNGRALVSVGDYGPALHGPVRADGSAAFRGAVDAPAAVTGRFEGGRFVGELKGWGCTYALDLAGQP